MAYSGPVFQSTERDVAPEYLYRGAAAMGQGINDLLSGVGAAVGNKIDERDKSKALQARFDLLEQEGYASPELRDKFYSGSTSQQAGIMAELMARMDREAAAGQQRESARRFDLGYGLDALRLNQQSEQFGQRMGFDRMQAQQDANYRNEQLRMQQQEQAFREKPVTWEQLNGTNYMVNPKGGALPLGGGEDDNPLGRLFALPGARVTSYGYRNDPTPDSNSAAGIGAFVPEAEQAKIKAGQPSPYRLQPGDIAVSPDIEARMRRAGVKPGDRVMFQRADGTSEAGRWMDRTSPSLSGRVDFYSPGGVRADDGAAITGFSLYAPAETPAQAKPQKEQITWKENRETGERNPYIFDPVRGGLVPVPVLEPEAAAAAAAPGQAAAKPKSRLEEWAGKYLKK